MPNDNLRTNRHAAVQGDDLVVDKTEAAGRNGVTPPRRIGAVCAVDGAAGIQRSRTHRLPSPPAISAANMAGVQSFPAAESSPAIRLYELPSLCTPPLCKVLTITARPIIADKVTAGESRGHRADVRAHEMLDGQHATSHQMLRGLSRGRPISPAIVQRQLQDKFRDRLWAA